MGNLADNYPALDPDSCDSLGLGGQCNEDCPLLKSGKKIRYNDNCYSPKEYNAIIKKKTFSIFTNIEIE